MNTIPLGEDILLARHGANIVKLRQDRRNRQTVAVLRNGGTDTASNQLEAVVLSPAASIGRGVQAYLNDETAIDRSELRSLAKLALGFTAVTGAIFGGLLWVSYRVGGEELLTDLTTAYGPYMM